MARKEATVVIELDGRDKNKAFFIREMPAAQGESWAVRAFLALAKSGVDIPENIANAGLAGIATLSLKAFGALSYADAEPLLAEMMSCVQIIPDPSRPSIMRNLVEDDIEEIKTRMFLRAQVLELHTGFSMTAGLSPSTAPAVSRANSSSTRTSRAR